MFEEINDISYRPLCTVVLVYVMYMITASRIHSAGS